MFAGDRRSGYGAGADQEELAPVEPQRQVDHPAHDRAGDAQKTDRLLGQSRGKAGQEFAILTNIIHEEWYGISVKQHKELKRLESHNIRDHMREAELIFTALAKLSTSQIAETEAAVGLPANKKAAKTAGKGWTGAFTRTTLKSASAGTVKVAVSDGRGSRGQKKTR
jgi:hypothetical protein